MSYPDVFYTTNAIMIFDDNTRKLIEIDPRTSMKGVKQFLNSNAESPNEATEASIYYQIKEHGEINIDCNDEFWSKYMSQHSNAVDVSIQIGTSL